jgi:dipeptidyl aminopeptidase/acylaminoacyl peptidase
MDKLFITGPPSPKNAPSPTAMGANNPIKFWCYLFFPKQWDPKGSYPLIILPHGGVHADFTTYYTHILRELLYQGYVVAAPEYRGSTGYGQAHYEKIDYGGLEVEDIWETRRHLLENYPFLDARRVGVMGWSHGGLIALMNAFHHPEGFASVFAGVPVSDLIARMGYYTDEYRALYSAPYHIGKTAHQDVQEYRRRSPAWNAHLFQNTPLLIHTNTNDDDVNVLEVEHLIKSLKAEGKQFDFEIFQDIPGGHSFDRIDTRQGRLIRIKIWQFLAKTLKPERPITDEETQRKAAYLPY